MSGTGLGGVAVAAAIVAAALGAQGADTAPHQPVSMRLYRGACQSLTAPDGDVSQACAPALINNLYSDGYVGYSFIRIDPATHAQSAISFFGDSTGQSPGALAVQGVILNGAAGGAQDMEARGTCTRFGPDDGAQTVNCEATTDDGMYTATFVSDGSKPQVRDMRPAAKP